jgi:protoporphyrinogen oxidase
MASGARQGFASWPQSHRSSAALPEKTLGTTIANLIIGAGPAGLTTAYQLAKGGAEVLVLEQDPQYVGGISRTAHYNGYLFDIGGHRFFSKSREVVELWDEILTDDFIDRPRLSRIFYRDKFYAYPLNAFEALRNLGLFTSATWTRSSHFERTSTDTLDANIADRYLESVDCEKLM